MDMCGLSVFLTMYYISDYFCYMFFQTQRGQLHGEDGAHHGLDHGNKRPVPSTDEGLLRVSLKKKMCEQHNGSKIYH